jgi:hypothetical protein
MRSFALAGHEIERAPARRSIRTDPPIVFPLSQAERRFLLYRLADRGAVADRILHTHSTSTRQMLPSWSRDQVLTRIDALIDSLRRKEVVIFISRLDRLLAIEAIEGNPYFAQMHESDPRLTVAAVRAAESLRQRLSASLGKRIGRVPLGPGRKRLSEPDPV